MIIGARIGMSRGVSNSRVNLRAQSSNETSAVLTKKPLTEVSLLFTSSLAMPLMQV